MQSSDVTLLENIAKIHVDKCLFSLRARRGSNTAVFCTVSNTKLQEKSVNFIITIKVLLQN